MDGSIYVRALARNRRAEIERASREAIIVGNTIEQRCNPLHSINVHLKRLRRQKS
ncbi:MAG TPA: hypothetical protein VKB86_09735 [Pyrinomonadaceae bacterium]|nr:hypothetical protein [Pyrinomonadaceae bacterium]